MRLSTNPAVVVPFAEDSARTSSIAVGTRGRSGNEWRWDRRPSGEGAKYGRGVIFAGVALLASVVVVTLIGFATISALNETGGGPNAAGVTPMDTARVGDRRAIHTALLLTGPMADSVVQTNVSVPVAGQVPVPCASGGSGDVVLFNGNIHMLVTLATDSSGGVHSSFLANPQGLSGTGLTTGDKYQGTGVTRGNFNLYPPFPLESTFIDNFRIIGQGTGNNLLVHATVHVTVSATGDLAANVVKTTIDCR